MSEPFLYSVMFLHFEFSFEFYIIRLENSSINENYFYLNFRENQKIAFKAFYMNICVNIFSPRTIYRGFKVKKNIKYKMIQLVRQNFQIEVFETGPI